MKKYSKKYKAYEQIRKMKNKMVKIKSKMKK
jgi:hypothetical protein